MIDLTSATVLGSGNGRTSYQHPDDPSLVLKIEGAPVKGRLRWYERPPNIRPSNHREIEGYSAMILRLGQSHDFVTRVLGWEHTSAGPALLAENATHGLDTPLGLNSMFKSAGTGDYSKQDIETARARYAEIADLYCAHKVYNHGMRPESIVIARRDGLVTLRLFDFKSIVYRQLISPRFLPRGEHNVQMLIIRSVLKKFDRLLATL